MCRLTRVLLARGTRVLTLSYHSPSLEPGHTPYVRNERDLARFLDDLSGFLSFFRDEIGGEFLTVREMRQRLLHTPPAPVRAPEITPRAAAAPPPAEDGRQALPGGRQHVSPGARRLGGGLRQPGTLRPRPRLGAGVARGLSFRLADPRSGGNTTARHRSASIASTCCAPRLLDEAPSFAGAASSPTLRDLTIRIDLLRAIRRIARPRTSAWSASASWWRAAGWRRSRAGCSACAASSTCMARKSAAACRTMSDGRRRRRALAEADAIVAVSRFTREALETTMDVPPEKIALISNGVDLQRFVPRGAPAGSAGALRPGRRRVLLTVGRLYARKGMDRVIESLPRGAARVARCALPAGRRRDVSRDAGTACRRARRARRGGVRRRGAAMPS